MDQYNLLAAIVVIYNTRLDRSRTCSGLLTLSGKGAHVIVFDNSTSDYGVKEDAEHLGWVYLNGHGNVGLSKAYNTCIDYLKDKHSDVEYICLFDDDTAIDETYFDVLMNEIDHYPADIYLPIVYSSSRILSPCKISKGYISRLFRTEQQALEYRGTDLSGINSGMAIHLSVFDSYRYDEGIFLDGIDHHFLMDMHQIGRTVHVIPYRCVQNFSGDSSPSEESAFFRYRLFVADHKYIFKKEPIRYWLLVLKRGVKLCIQYKSTRFFVLLWNHKN